MANPAHQPISEKLPKWYFLNLARNLELEAEKIVITDFLQLTPSSIYFYKKSRLFRNTP